MSRAFVFDEAYRKTAEYIEFCMCCQEGGLDPAKWDMAITLHKSDPVLHKKMNKLDKQNKDKPKEEPKIETEMYCVEVIKGVTEEESSDLT